MLELTDFPALNASLNATTAALLVTGFACIRARRIPWHRACMLAAFAVSIVFLACYLWYHAHVGSRHFPGVGTARTVYLGILLTHTVLAATVPFLAAVTLFQGLKSRFPAHKKIARWTLPIWLYVSVTGVVVYWMLYRVTW